MLLTRRLKVSCTRQRPRHTSTQKWANATDGDAYHRSAVARDRDRLRQEVLEKLGWKIHRIWSTDWIRDSKGALKRLLYRIEELNNEDDPPLLDDPSDHDPDNGDDPDGELSHHGGIPLTAPDDPYAGFVGEHTDTPPSHRDRDDFYDGDDSDVLEDIQSVVVHEGP